MVKSTIFIDGQFVCVSTKTLEVFTPGIFKAKGVFETMLAVGNKVFDIEQHLKRLHLSYPKVRMTRRTIEQTVQLNGLDQSRVRVLVWEQSQERHVAVMAMPYKRPTKDVLKLCVIKTNRKANARNANRKSLDYQLFSEAYAQAKANGFDEALLTNEKGNIFEASRANVFWVQEGKLHTPPLSSGCLNGIIRQHVIIQARRLKISIIEKNITPAQIKSATQIYLTNSLMGMVPGKLLV